MKPSIVTPVSVIVLNWNGWEDTLDCLASLEKLDYPNYEVVVVDNGSTDGSEDKIREVYPAVTVLQTGCNLGFAGGNNVGIDYALKNGAEYVWLLNNDTLVDPAALTRLVEEAASDASIGMVGSKIYYDNPPDLVWFAGGTVDMLTGRTVHEGWHQRDPGKSGEPRDVGYLTGCSVLVSRRVVDYVGLMDTSFFLYYEETDWELRARQSGWRIRYQPRSIVWHKISKSSGLDSPTQVFHFARSRMIFAKRHIPAGTLWPLLVTVRHQVLPFLVRGRLYTAMAGIRGLMSGIIDA